MADTMQAPGGDAAVVRVHGKEKAIAMTTDVSPRYCKADPKMGAMQAVAEAWRNLTAVGAHPLAVTDNLNFREPRAGRDHGRDRRRHRRHRRILPRARLSGRVGKLLALHNETNGEAILPTPAIGAVGLLKSVRRMATPSPSSAKAKPSS